MNRAGGEFVKICRFTSSVLNRKRFSCLSLSLRQVLKPHEPVYQAIWVDNMDFDEVLISPAMIQDHMPDTVLAALNKVSMMAVVFLTVKCPSQMFFFFYLNEKIN